MNFGLASLLLIYSTPTFGAATFTVTGANPATGIATGGVDIDNDGTDDGTWELNAQATGGWRTFNAVAPVPDGVGFDMRANGNPWDLDSEFTVTLNEPGVTFQTTFYSGLARDTFTKFNHATSYTFNWIDSITGSTVGTSPALVSDTRQGTDIAGNQAGQVTVPWQISSTLNAGGTLIQNNNPVGTSSDGKSCIKGSGANVRWSNRCSDWYVAAPQGNNKIFVDNVASSVFEGFRFGLVSFAELGVDKKVSAPEIAQGDSGFYTITLKNTKTVLGDSAATGIVLTDILPPGVNYVSHSSVYNKLGPHSFTDGSVGTITESGGTLNLTNGKVHIGDEIVITVNFTVSPTATPNSTITNDILSGALDMAQTDVDLTNNTSSADFKVLETALSVVKPAPVNADEDGNGELSVNDTLTYTITMTNDGAATLTNVVLTDSLLAAPNDTITCASVAPGATCVLSGDYVVTQTDVDAGGITNNATADSDQTDESTASNTSPILAPSLSVVKPAPVNADEDGNGELSVNDTLTYTITMTNDGDATLTNVVLTDDLLAAPNDTITCASVAPGTTCVLTGNYTVTQADVDAGGITNNATADSDQTDESPASNTSPILAPSLSVVKPAPVNADEDGNGELSVNDTLTYTITMTNDGDATLTNVVLTDDLLAAPNDTITCASVAPGTTCVLTGNYTVTQADVDAGGITNNATADSDQTDESPASNTSPILAPSLSVVKPAPVNADEDGNGELSVNDTLTYTITMTNDGDATLTNVVLTDDLLTAPNDTITCASVAPGATCVLSGDYVVTQTDVDAGGITNNATADSDQTPESPASNTSPILAPSLSVVKPAPVNADEDGNGELSVNDTLTYTITMTNDGAATLTNVVLTDSLLAAPNDTITCASVAPGATCVLTGDYVVTQTDVDAGGITNNATADSDQTPESPASNTSPILAPSLSVVKPAPVNADEDGNGELSVNDTLTYTITMTNDGAATLTNVVLTDSLLAAPNDTITCASVAPGATCVLSGDYVVTQTDVDAGGITNNATADSDQTPESPASNTSPILVPSLSVVKPAPVNADEDGNGELSVNDTLTYTITMTNDGAATLTNVVLTDSLLAAPNDTITCASVAPGATCVLTGNYVVTQTDVDAGGITNNATADSDQTPESPASNTSPILAPSLSVVKPAPVNADEDGNGELSVNDTLTYTITMTNDGAATLTNVVLTDSLLAAPNDTITCASVAPGATCVLTGDYVVTQTDVDAGGITNNATADSDQTDESPASITSPILAPSLSVVKPAPVNADEDGNGELSVNDTLTYTITMTNDGAATLTNVVLTDSLLAAPNDTITCASVAPGATCVLTGDYVVTQTDVDAGGITNNATADSDQTDESPASNTSPILAPSLSVVKPAPVNADEDGNGELSVNDTLTYTITMTNDGAATLTNVVLTDSLLAAPNDTITCASVAPGATCVLSGDYVVTQTDVDAGSITNNATADSDQTDESPASNTSSINEPSLSVVKPAPVNADEDANGEISEGDTLTYSITMTNDGTATLTNVVLTDSLLAAPNDTITCASVAPGATCVLTGDYVVTQTDVDAGGITNNATADSDQTEESPATNTTFINEPSLSVIKPAPVNADEDGNGELSVNDTLTYTITMTNDGAATLTNVVLTDSLLAAPNDTITCASVAPGATCVLSGDYVVTQTDVDAGVITNNATADSDQTDESTASNTSSINAPGLTIIKPAPVNADEDGNGEISEGDTLTYSITATNNGAATLTNLIITDNMITPNTLTCASVAPSETCELSGTYIVKPADVATGGITNNATADSDQTDESTASNISPINAPALTVVKPAPINADEDGNGEVSEGDTLTYTITATNNGAATLTNLIITDNKITPNTFTCASVAPSGTCVLSGTYVVTAADVAAGEISNNATADSDQTDESTASNTSSINSPGLSVVKPDPVNADEDANTEISAGDTLTYTITATNNATATLTNVVVTDNLLIAPNNTITCTTLAPSETCILTGDYVVTADDVTAGDVVNNAIANSDQTEETTATNTSSVNQGSASLEKLAPTNADEDGNGVISTGDTLTYTVTMTNTGTAILSNVVVSDPLITPNSFTCATLAPAATCVLTGTKVVAESDVNAGEIINTATGTSSQTEPVSDSVTVKTANPEIRSAKSASEPRLNADGTFDIDYNIIVKNTGTVTLNNLTVNDDLATQLGSSLASIVTSPTVSFVSNASGSSQLPTANTAFTGVSPATNLTIGYNGQLYAGDSYQVKITVRINPNAANAPTEYSNQAIAGGSSGSLAVSDLSDSGNNPDGDNTDATTSFIPPEQLPKVQATKFAGTPILNSDLTFNVPFTIIVKNTGNVNLTALSLEDNMSLNTQMGSALLSIVEAPIAGISNNISGTAIAPTANSAFDGRSTNPDLLAGNDGLIAPEDEYTVTFVVRVDPRAVNAPESIKNQAITGGISPSGASSSDLSGSNTDENGQNSAPGEQADNDQPTTLSIALFNIPKAELLISKVASKKEASAGDLVPYTVLVKNKSNFLANGVTLVDDLPNGFNIAKDSIRVLSFDAEHTLLNTNNAVTSGNDPISISGLSIPIEASGYLKISYLVKIGTTAQGGRQCNTIQATVNASSNKATACVLIKENTALDQSTLIGKVFHDRDGDGYQDPANVTGITVKSDYFGWNSLHLGGLNGRVSVLDNPEKHRKVIRMPITKSLKFKVITQQGTVILVDNRGEISTAHIGDKKKGLTAQDIRVTTRRIKGIPTQTPVKAMRVPAKTMDVLEITITNHGIHEEGIPGVRIATVEGLLIETDGYGRYHLPDVDGGRRSLGKNIILKVDTATLPRGSHFTTENPRVLRLTGTALNKVNFGVKLPTQKQTIPSSANSANTQQSSKTGQKVGGVSENLKTVKVDLKDDFFVSNSVQIQSRNVAVLDQIANAVKEHGSAEVNVIVANKNLGLAKLRANAVRKALHKKLGNLMGHVKVNTQ